MPKFQPIAANDTPYELTWPTNQSYPRLQVNLSACILGSPNYIASFAASTRIARAHEIKPALILFFAPDGSAI